MTTFKKFTLYDVFISCVSLISYLADVVTDVWLLVHFFENGDHVWGSLTLAFVAAATLMMLIFSFQWHAADKTLSWPVFIFHALFLAPLHRYIQVIRHGFKARSSGKEEDLDVAYRELNDVCILRLFETFLESAPQLVLQLYIILRYHNFSIILGVSTVFSLTSVAWAVTAYSDALRLAYKQYYKRSWAGIVSQTLWQMGMVAARVCAVVLFSTIFHAWVFIPIGLHLVLMVLWIGHQNPEFGSTPCERRLFTFVVAFVYNFCFINLKDGRSRWRMVTFYALMFAENLIFLLVWFFFKAEDTPIWYQVMAFTGVLGGFLLGVICVCLYYGCCHPSGPVPLSPQKPQFHTPMPQPEQIKPKLAMFDEASPTTRINLWLNASLDLSNDVGFGDGSRNMHQTENSSHNRGCGPAGEGRQVCQNGNRSLPLVSPNAHVPLLNQPVSSLYDQQGCSSFRSRSRLYGCEDRIDYSHISNASGRFEQQRDEGYDSHISTLSSAYRHHTPSHDHSVLNSRGTSWLSSFERENSRDAAQSGQNSNDAISPSQDPSFYMKNRLNSSSLQNKGQLSSAQSDKLNRSDLNYSQSKYSRTSNNDSSYSNSNAKILNHSKNSRYDSPFCTPDRISPPGYSPTSLSPLDPYKLWEESQGKLKVSPNGETLDVSDLPKVHKNYCRNMSDPQGVTHVLNTSPKDVSIQDTMNSSRKSDDADVTHHDKDRWRAKMNRNNSTAKSVDSVFSTNSSLYLPGLSSQPDLVQCTHSSNVSGNLSERSVRSPWRAPYQDQSSIYNNMNSYDDENASGKLSSENSPTSPVRASHQNQSQLSTYEHRSPNIQQNRTVSSNDSGMSDQTRSSYSSSSSTSYQHQSRRESRLKFCNNTSRNQSRSINSDSGMSAVSPEVFHPSTTSSGPSSTSVYETSFPSKAYGTPTFLQSESTIGIDTSKQNLRTDRMPSFVQSHTNSTSDSYDLPTFLQSRSVTCSSSSLNGGRSSSSSGRISEEDTLYDFGRPRSRSKFFADPLLEPSHPNPPQEKFDLNSSDLSKPPETSNSSMKVVSSQVHERSDLSAYLSGLSSDCDHSTSSPDESLSYSGGKNQSMPDEYYRQYKSQKMKKAKSFTHIPLLNSHPDESLPGNLARSKSGSNLNRLEISDMLSRSPLADIPWRVDYITSDPVEQARLWELFKELSIASSIRCSIASSSDEGSRETSRRGSAAVNLEQFENSPYHLGRSVDLFNREGWRASLDKDTLDRLTSGMPSASMDPKKLYDLRSKHLGTKNVFNIPQLAESPYKFRKSKLPEHTEIVKDVTDPENQNSEDWKMKSCSSSDFHPEAAKESVNQICGPKQSRGRRVSVPKRILSVDSGDASVWTELNSTTDSRTVCLSPNSSVDRRSMSYASQSNINAGSPDTSYQKTVSNVNASTLSRVSARSESSSTLTASFLSQKKSPINITGINSAFKPVLPRKSNETFVLNEDVSKDETDTSQNRSSQLGQTYNKSSNAENSRLNSINRTGSFLENSSILHSRTISDEENRSVQWSTLGSDSTTASFDYTSANNVNYFQLAGMSPLDFTGPMPLQTAGLSLLSNHSQTDSIPWEDPANTSSTLMPPPADRSKGSNSVRKPLKAMENTPEFSPIYSGKDSSVGLEMSSRMRFMSTPKLPVSSDLSVSNNATGFLSLSDLQCPKKRLSLGRRNMTNPNNTSSWGSQEDSVWTDGKENYDSSASTYI